MPKQTKNKTRVDYLVEEVFGPTYDMFDEDEFSGIDLDPKKQAKDAVRKEDELIWAFYHDPESDVTQIEARDRAQSRDYPDRYNLSQSSISRKMSDLDERMLTHPVERLNQEESGIHDAPGGLLDCPQHDGYKRHAPDVLEKYRESLARTLVDAKALEEFTSGQEVTPEWARERFPDLDPDRGRKYCKREGLVDDPTDLHPPTDDLTEPRTPAPSDD